MSSLADLLRLTGLRPAMAAAAGSRSASRAPSVAGSRAASPAPSFTTDRTKFQRPRALRVVNGRLGELQTHYKKYEVMVNADRERDRTVHRRCDEFTPEVQRINHVGGREREMSFWKVFNHVASKSQERPMPAMHRRIVRDFLVACLPKMYGADLERYLPDILRRYKIDHINARCLVSMPRRHGKTETSCAFLASLALAMAVEVNVYSTGLETSKLLTAKVEWYLAFAAGPHLEWGKHNMHMVEVRPLESDKDKFSTIRSYSSSPKG